MQTHYQAPNKTLWQGRKDSKAASCFFQQIKFYDLLKDTPKTSLTFPTFALLGFKCDEGIKRNLGRQGASAGPDAIRHILAKLSVPFENLACYDAGNIICLDHDLEASQKSLGDAIHLLLKQGFTPIILGGGHEVAFGHYQGIHRTFPNEPLSIVNFDAHFDMRPLLADQKGSSGTPFLQIANAQKENHHSFHYHCIGIQLASNTPSLLETAKEHHTQFLLAEDIHLGNQKQCDYFIDRIIQQNNLIYLSFCLDVIAQAFAPGVSAPQSLGLTPWQIIPLLRKLAQSRKIVSYDIAELCPRFDIDERTAKLAAHFIYEIISHHQPKV